VGAFNASGTTNREFWQWQLCLGMLSRDLVWVAEQRSVSTRAADGSLRLEAAGNQGSEVQHSRHPFKYGVFFFHNV
jgi:hypothetical protein